MAYFSTSYPVGPLPSRTFRYKGKLFTTWLCNTMHSERGAAQAFNLLNVIHCWGLVLNTVKLDGAESVLEPQGTTTPCVTQQLLDYYTEDDVIEVEADTQPTLMQRCLDPDTAAEALGQLAATVAFWWTILLCVLLSLLLAPMMPFILPVVGWMSMTVYGATACIKRAITSVRECSKLLVPLKLAAAPVFSSALKRLMHRSIG